MLKTVVFFKCPKIESEKRYFVAVDDIVALMFVAKTTCKLA